MSLFYYVSGWTQWWQYLYDTRCKWHGVYRTYGHAATFSGTLALLTFLTTHAKASCHRLLTCFNKYVIYTQVQDKILNTHIIQHALL